LSEILGRDSWAVGINQTHRFKAAPEQIPDREIQTLTEMIAALRQQTEIDWENIGVNRLSADGRVNSNSATLRFVALAVRSVTFRF
jgi:hypothetical protein